MTDVSRIPLPPSLHRIHFDMVQATVASPSTFRRLLSALDFAISKLVRDEQSPPFVRFELSDASYMKGYDWMWSQYHEVRLDKAWVVFDAYSNLKHALDSYCDGRDEIFAEDGQSMGELDGSGETGQPWKWRRHAPDDAWMPWLRTIEEHIKENVNPPMALGGGHRKLADKAGAELYKWCLACRSMDGLRKMSASFHVHCGDMGGRNGLAGFRDRFLRYIASEKLETR